MTSCRPIAVFKNTNRFPHDVFHHLFKMKKGHYTASAFRCKEKQINANYFNEVLNNRRPGTTSNYLHQGQDSTLQYLHSHRQLNVNCSIPCQLPPITSF